MDIYETSPEFVSEHFHIRQTCMDDCADLLKVYSDTAAVPIFNSDNCTGDFYMTTMADMADCISFWLSEYAQRYYIRWSILDRSSGCAIGTIELFHRTSQDFYNHVGLLRLDLRSDYETDTVIREILSALLPPAFALFECSRMATKAVPCAKERIQALTSLGFTACPEFLYGHDGRAYGDYYILDK